MQQTYASEIAQKRAKTSNRAKLSRFAAPTARRVGRSATAGPRAAPRLGRSVGTPESETRISGRPGRSVGDAETGLNFAPPMLGSTASAWIRKIRRNARIRILCIHVHVYRTLPGYRTLPVPPLQHLFERLPPPSHAHAADIQVGRGAAHTGDLQVESVNGEQHGTRRRGRKHVAEKALAVRFFAKRITYRLSRMPTRMACNGCGDTPQPAHIPLTARRSG